MTDQAPGSRCLVDLVRTFRNYKSLGDRALLQVSDADLHTSIDPDAKWQSLSIPKGMSKQA